MDPGPWMKFRAQKHHKIFKANIQPATLDTWPWQWNMQL